MSKLGLEQNIWPKFLPKKKNTSNVWKSLVHCNCLLCRIEGKKLLGHGKVFVQWIVVEKWKKRKTD